MKKLLIFSLMVFALLSSSVVAQNLLPDIPKATGKPHPEGNEYMRINHMDMLKHDRDITMHEGIRDTNNSLAQCINCHVVKGEDDKPVTIKSEEHFCRVCHDYVAVKLDCFSCHNSVPQGSLSLSFSPYSHSSAVNLFAYLEESVK